MCVIRKLSVYPDYGEAGLEIPMFVHTRRVAPCSDRHDFFNPNASCGIVARFDNQTIQSHTRIRMLKSQHNRRMRRLHGVLQALIVMTD